MTDRPIVGIVLAAGMSRRLGRPKQLLELDGKSLVARTVECLLATRLDRVVVVIGHEGEAVREALAGYPVAIVENPDFAGGQSTSLKTGLRSAQESDAVVIALADQPGIVASAVDALIDARRASRVLIGMSAYGDERSHPILFGREVFEELAAIEGDQGGRDVIRRHWPDVVTVPGGADTVPIDVDTEEAYARLRDSRTHT